MSVPLATQLKDLEHTLRNPSKEPVKLTYQALQTITRGFSEVIGRGGFGVVFLGHLPAGGKIAVKQLYGLQVIDDKLFMQEFMCLKRAKHDNIVRFLGYCLDTQGKIVEHEGNHIIADERLRFLCFEYVENGNLHEYLTKDLKPQNVMLDDQMKPKITDFGLSRTFAEGQTSVVTTNIFGTLGYVAPELIEERKISFKADIFSLGIIIIKLLTGDDQYDTENWQNSLDMDGPEAKVCITIAQACLHADRHKRPTIGEIVHDLNELQNVISQTGNHTSSLQHQVQTLMTNKLLDVCPNKLRLPSFKPNGLISSPVRLTNKTDAAVAFRLVPAERESPIVLELHGILPPSSTRTYLVRMEKQPPASLHEFMITLECCMADEYIAEDDFADHFSPENPDRNELHETTLMAVIGVGEMTKVVCRNDQSERITAMDVHPTEPWVLAGHYDGRFTMWNYNTQEKLMDLKVASWIVGSVAFIAREQWLIVGDVHGKIHVYAYNTKEHVKTFEAHEDDVTVYHLSVHPSKPWLLSGCGQTGIIKLWDWTDNWKRIRTYKAHASTYVNHLMFDPMDSNAFCSTGLDGKIKFWKTGTARCTKEVDCEGNQVCVDYFQPPGADRRYMITGCSSGRARIWDLETYTCIRTIEGLQERGINAYLPDHQLLVAALSDGTISLYSFSTESWCDNVIDFKLGKVGRFAYVDGIKSVAIAFERGIAMMEIN